MTKRKSEKEAPQLRGGGYRLRYTHILFQGSALPLSYFEQALAAPRDDLVPKDQKSNGPPLKLPNNFKLFKWVQNLFVYTNRFEFVIFTLDRMRHDESAEAHINKFYSTRNESTLDPPVYNFRKQRNFLRGKPPSALL